MKQDRQTITIAPKTRWLLGLLLFLLLAQLVMPSRAWTILLLGLGGTLAFSYLWARQMAGKLEVIREQYYGWVHVGDLLEERFTLRNNSFLPSLWVEVDDHSDLPGYSAQSVRVADGNQVVQWRTEGICRQRGLFTLGPWQVRTGDPLGFFQVTLDHPGSQTILVYPPIVHLPALRLPRGAATGAGRTSRRALEVTTNAAGVRAYAPGDSINRIHWRSTARMDDLMVKTFDLEPSGDLWIVLDLDAAVQAGEGDESTEEYAVVLGASLSNRTLSQNRAVGLFAYGTTGPHGGAPEPLPILVMPQKGTAHQWRILHALATVRAGGNWPLARVLAEMNPNMGRGTTLAVITPSCDPEWIAGLLPPMRRGVTPTVVLLDPVSFGGQGNVEALTGLLAELGISSHLIPKGIPFRPIAEHKRIGRPEYKVLPGTGRVIVVEP
ncbi:MAG: DUF58 domain-containing protein [Anaerolineae bacterium]|nr:DUF58 domain-containing protein [Anaerolineae bacterium]